MCYNEKQGKYQFNSLLFIFILDVGFEIGAASERNYIVIQMHFAKPIACEFSILLNANLLYRICSVIQK